MPSRYLLTLPVGLLMLDRAKEIQAIHPFIHSFIHSPGAANEGRSDGGRSHCGNSYILRSLAAWMRIRLQLLHLLQCLVHWLNATTTTTTTTTREEEEKENHQCSGSPHALLLLLLLLPLLLLLCRKGHHLSIRVKPFIIYKRGVQYKHTHTDTRRRERETIWCVAGAVLGLRSTPLGDWQQQQQRRSCK